MPEDALLTGNMNCSESPCRGYFACTLC